MEELVKDKNAFIHQLQEKHWEVWLEKHENQSAFVKPVVLILL
jgi:hypothetical protein